MKKRLLGKNVIITGASSGIGRVKAYTKYAYGIDRFGLSANANVVIPYLGFTKEAVAKELKKYLK